MATSVERLGPLQVVSAGLALRRSAGPTLDQLTHGGQRTVTARLGGRKVVLLTEPDDIRHLLVDVAKDTVKGAGVQRTRPLLGNGLLTSEGETHRRQRALVATAFSPSRLAAAAAVMRERSEEYVASIQGSGMRDVHADLGRVALTVVGDTILGLRLDAHADAVREAMEGSTAQFRQGMWRGRPRMREQASELIPLVDSLIADRRRAAVPGPDVLWSLLEAVDEQGDQLSDVEIRDQVITLMLAGHETTANAMSFALSYLASRPDVVADLRAEQDAAGDAALDPRGLPVMRSVVSETLRLRPPAWIFGRRLLRDVTFGEVPIAEDTLVAVSPWVLHHSARWFDEPAAFDPSRWLDERAAAVPRHAYLPFGAGPRGCIGEQFAMIEAGVVLGTLVSGLEFTRTGPEARLEFGVTLRPGGGLPLRVAPRRTAAV